MLVYMKFIILLLSILCIVSGYSTNKPRVWERIPQYFVSNRVVGFLNENRITNCFEYVETETNLLLFVIAFNFILIFLLYITLWRNMELESPIRYMLNLLPVIIYFQFKLIDKELWSYKK